MDHQQAQLDAAANDGFMPENTGRSLPIALLRARECVMERFRPMLAQHGITEQQWRVLRVLAEQDWLEASRVAERACIMAPSLTRMVKLMGEAGYVRSREDDRDGRRLLLGLTKAGLVVIAEARPESSRIYADIEAAMGADAMELLLDSLDHLQVALKR